MIHETLSFPVAHCEGCGRDVLVAHGLDAAGRVRPQCTRCDAWLPETGSTRDRGAVALAELGYDVEGEGEATRGCGGSCGGGCGPG